MLASDQKLTASGLSPTAKKLLRLRETVLLEWENDVRRLIPGAAEILHPILINTLPVFYENLAEAISPGHPREHATSNNDLATAHGNERARLTSFSPDQVVHEYQIFREVVARIAQREGIAMDQSEWMVLNASIDSAIREAVKEFTAMHEAFRHRLAGSLSHDMRNPLSVLMGSAQLLGASTNDARRPELVKKIMDNGARLDTMIEKLLNALSFRQGQRVPLTLSIFDIMDVVEKIASEVAASGRDKPIVIGNSVTGYWCCDSITRAVENLVTNAIKYGDGQEIRIKVDELHGRLLLSVHNSGPAILKEHQQHIFQYLWRERENTVLKGWGIGLPFVQSMAESHGGSVAVDSSELTGTTFLVDIPVDCRPFVTANAPSRR